MLYMKFSASLLAFPDIENLPSVISLDYLKMKIFSDSAGGSLK